MFERSLHLLDEYSSVGGKLGIEIHSHLLAEVRERLLQLNYILGRIREVEASHADQERRLRISMSEQWQHVQSGVTDSATSSGNIEAIHHKFFESVSSASIELRVLTESFYYFAARIRGILRGDSSYLPMLASFEVVGVRNVRNHLIEHPEGRGSRIFAQSFAFGGREGPVLKSGRPRTEPDAHQDRGLYINAEEFRSDFERVVEAAIKEMEKTPARPVA